MHIRKRSIAALLVASLVVSSVLVAVADENLVRQGGLPVVRESVPAGYVMTGGVTYKYLGDRHRDNSESGFAMQSAKGSGSVSYAVGNLDAKKQKWYRFSIRGLPQDGFKVGPNDLMMKVAFFGDHGKNELRREG